MPAAAGKLRGMTHAPFASRLSRAPLPFDEDRGREAWEPLELDPAFRELIVGTAAPRPISPG